MKNSIEKLKSLPGGMMKWYLNRSLKMKIVVAAAFIVLIVEERFKRFSPETKVTVI